MKNLNKMKIAPDMQYEIGQDKVGYFPEWSVKDDETLRKKVENLAHSTFDRSKFTVVGSPNITDDGIASGLGANDLVTINQKLFGTSWQLKMLVKPVINTVDIKSQCFASMKKSSGGGVDFQVYTNSGATTLMCGIPNQGSISASNALTPNTWQTIEIKYLNKMLSMYVEGERVGDSLSIDLDNWVPENNLQFGYNNWGAGIFVYYGFIDLKGVEVSVDGVLVFSGNQTGIDTIKPNDYTVVGSPTITDDGVARGFSNSNYLEKNISISSTNYKIETIAKPSGQSGDIVWGTYTTVTQCPRLQLQSNSVLLVLNDSIVAITIPITWDTSSYYKFISEFDGSKYTLSVYKNEILVGSNTYISNVNYISNATKLSIGRFINNTYFQGTIDLNSFKIYVNDELVYQPCLKIPYTEGQNYVKVVDKLYRDRVKDLFEQKGYNGYYTIGEDDFTLPSNKWSDVIEHKENGLTVAEQRVDQTLTIRGACEQGVDVNLPMEFFSADSYAVFGVGTTGTNTASKFTPAADGNYIAIGKGKV